jgi:hypothetical protein
MDLVWTECIRQANEMLDFWKGRSDIRQTGKDVRRFSLHVSQPLGSENLITLTAPLMRYCEKEVH